MTLEERDFVYAEKLQAPFLFKKILVLELGRKGDKEKGDFLRVSPLLLDFCSLAPLSSRPRNTYFFFSPSRKMETEQS